MTGRKPVAASREAAEEGARSRRAMMELQRAFVSLARELEALDSRIRDVDASAPEERRRRRAARTG
jgi:hypothetical protein